MRGMRFMVSLLLICTFCALLVGGLAGVLRQMMRRDWIGEPRTRRAPSDLDLPRDLDHALRRQVEPVDDLGGVAVEKGE